MYVLQGIHLCQGVDTTGMLNGVHSHTTKAYPIGIGMSIILSNGRHVHVLYMQLIIVHVLYMQL